MMRKTKIICTLGPASSSDAMLSALLRGGMDAARFNFSHGSHASHLAMLEKLRAACRQEGISVATILLRFCELQPLRRSRLRQGVPHQSSWLPATALP